MNSFKNLKQEQQASPINREMRQLINSLQNHNRQLKAEVSRYKKKAREYQGDLERQRQLNEVKQAKEDEVMKDLNALENDILITGLIKEYNLYQL